MNRKQLLLLDKWLTKTNRKPLILSGARQVGKSTLVKIFSEHANRPLAEINLERYSNLTEIFEQKDPTKIVDLLEALPNIKPISADTLLFLDEIQATPEAIPALRYFYEDMSELPVISAGSLLEFALIDHNFSMPVGRIEYLHIGPMTFTEFLDAIDESKLATIIRSFELGATINPVIHNRFLELLRTYYFVGGMPEAIKIFAHSKRLNDVSEVHNSIIETYRDDFPKYIGNRNLSRIQTVFNFAARNVGKKVKYTRFSTKDKSATIKKDIDLLCMARVLSKVIHSHSNGLPLQAELEEKIYKLIFLDVGLMNAISGLGWSAISKMSDTSLVNEGVIAEQFIGQHLQDLLASSPNRELTYWLREGRSTNAEVDYVFSINGKIIPIEIKSGATGSLKSLHQFIAEKNGTIAIRFDTNLPNQHTIETTIRQSSGSKALEYTLISLPLYLVEQLPHLDI